MRMTPNGTHGATAPRLAMLRPIAFVAAAAAIAPSATTLPSASPLATPGPLAASAPASLPLVQKDKKDRKAPKGYCANFQMGFKFREPKQWENIALKVDEEWMGANYVSEKAYTYHDKDIGYTVNHQPELKVIVFPHEVTKRKRVEKEENEDGDTVVWTISNPYKDYDDFLKRTFAGGGYYLQDEEEDEEAGVKVTKLLYNVEKGARQGPQHIQTWIYHAEDADYAVQLIGLQNHWREIERRTKQVRATFELIERDGPLKNSGMVSGGLKISRLDLEEKDEKERESTAKMSEEAIKQQAIDSLPEEGWEHFEEDRVLVVHSCDDDWAERVAKHTNNLFEWLDDNFGYVGEDVYLREPVIRICKDLEEARYYSAGISSGSGGGGFDMDDELLTYWDSAGWTGGAIDWYNRNAFNYWILEKNFDLATSMPLWIRNGISSLVETARLDTRKPDWRYDSSNTMALKNAIYYETATPVKDMFLMTSKEFDEKSKENREMGTSPYAEGAMLINYLASPEIRRHRLAKDLLEDYLKNMMVVIAEIEKEQERELERYRKDVKDEGDEKEYRQRRAQLFEKMEKELLQRTFDRTFEDWDDRDWENLTEHFHRAY